MILDCIKHIRNYKGISKHMDTAIDFLIENDLSEMNVGKYIIDGDNVYYMIQEYETKNIEDGKFEAHRKYIDIQLVLRGREFIGYAPEASLNPVSDYDAVKDKIILEGKEELHRLDEGMFGIYFPNDGHKPSINDEKAMVKKVVLKVKV